MHRSFLLFTIYNLTQFWSKSHPALVKNISSFIDPFANLFLPFQRHVNSFPAFYATTTFIFFSAFVALNEEQMATIIFAICMRVARFTALMAMSNYIIGDPFSQP